MIEGGEGRRRDTDPLSDLSAVEGAWHEVTRTWPQVLYYMYGQTHSDESTAEVIPSLARQLSLSIRLSFIVKAARRGFHSNTPVYLCFQNFTSDMSFSL